MQGWLHGATALADVEFLDVISVNVWNILISLLNLVLLFLIVKRFLFKPVKRVLAERQASIDGQYAAAAEARRLADERQEAWESRLAQVDTEADARLAHADEAARRRAEQIVRKADERAEEIMRSAENEVALERRRASEDMKREIVELGTALAEKMLERELCAKDHRAMIADVIGRIGEENGTSRT